jgi:hypothetical protein
MNALSLLMMFVLFAPVCAMVTLNLALYGETRYLRQPPAPMSPATCDALVLAEEPAEANALRRAYELRKAA